ncbi:MAG: homoserine dehydrogenase [Rhizobiales bacterium]|nr:homoserine dehydrogenase [Hyphomicrobiales bacterium]
MTSSKTPAYTGNLPADLAARLAATGRPIRVGLIGSGEMGTDIVTQCDQMTGITVAAIAEVRPGAAAKALHIAGRDSASHRDANTQSSFDAALESGKTALTENAQLVCSSPHVDVVIDATGRPGVGAEIGLTAMEHGKHLVMMNVEADVTIGSYLMREAKRLGVVYTLGAGDEPSSCIELINFVKSLGYPIVAAGKGKNNPLNIKATPDEYAAEAKARNMNARMLVEFVDGSKTMVEMAAISNATGLVPDCPGMHGPAATLDVLAETLCPKEDGGVLSRTGVVDYSIGKGVAPGVFVITKAPHARIHERLTDLKMGKGPYFKFIRPYHLTSLEVPLSCARAVLYKSADMVPLDAPVSEVCAVAKKDLVPGERLDAIGEYTYRAWIMERGEAAVAKAVPCGLLEGGKVTKPIKMGELLTTANCAVDTASKIYELRQRQDNMLKAKAA